MSDETRNKIEEIFEYYKTETTLNQSELVIALLTELQETAGYLSEDMRTRTAEAAGVSPGYVLAVIRQLPHLHTRSFQHEIRICISDRCKNKGARDVLEEFQRILKIRPGQVTKDGAFLLTTVYCMHMCTKGANLTIDGTPCHNVTPADVPDIIQNITGPLSPK